MNTTPEQALAAGRELALTVMDQRRQDAAKAAPTPQLFELRRESAASLAMVEPLLERATIRRTSAGWLVAEGDSWFAYSRQDILATLADAPYNFDVEHVAQLGDGLKEMATDRQTAAFVYALEKLLRVGKIPHAILLSGGGNDVVKDKLDPLLNPIGSAPDELNQEELHTVVDVQMRNWLLTIIGRITQSCETLLQRRIPILIHGYDYPVPDGRFIFGGVGSSWSWLYPGLKRQGYVDLQQNTLIMERLIDRLNDMLIGLHTIKDCEHVKHINLRNTLSRQPANYKKDWSNELHPTPAGFKTLTAKMGNAIKALTL